MTFLRVFLVLYIPNIVAYMRGRQGQGQGRARLEVDYLAEEAAQRCQESCTSPYSQQSQLRPAALRCWPLLQQLGHTWSPGWDSSVLTLPHCPDNS